MPVDMISLLEANGCPTKVERGNRAFPVSDHASDGTRAMERALRAAGVEISLNTEVLSLEKTAEGGFLLQVRNNTRHRKEQLETDAVIVCTGGLSYASTGSTGDGYRFARAAGLEVTDQVPALVPLTVEEEDYREMQGVSLKNVSIRITEEGGSAKHPVMDSEPGELLFTHFGLSGPLILSASSLISRGLSEGKRYVLEIDLKPGLDEEMLDARILRDLEAAQNQQLSNALSRLLIASLRPVVLARAVIPPETKARDLGKARRQQLVHAVKHLSFHVIGTRGFAEAVITQGGVSVREINPKTMEAKKCPGLYFAGEVLDVDAYTGGFNLQIAWSTGHAAGQEIC